MPSLVNGQASTRVCDAGASPQRSKPSHLQLYTRFRKGRCDLDIAARLVQLCASGRLDYAFNRRFDFKRERGTQTWTGSLVKRRRFKVFLASFWMEVIGHRPTRRRASSKTSLPGMALTLPERTSSRRRTASEDHNRSISVGSSVARLSTNFSTNEIFESAGRSIAASVICSKVSGISEY